MANEPSYLDLLNRIAVGEGEAECFLEAWAEVTPNQELRPILTTIALREGEHSKSFAKRMCELGFSVKPKDPAEIAEKVAIASSCELSDREKFEKLDIVRYLNEEGDDVFAPMFNDKNIDIQTGTLLGRYIAEERDSTRMLRGCYGELCAAENGQPATAAIDGLSARLTRIEDMLDKLVTKAGKR